MSEEIKPVKPCVKCGAMDRYKDGRCKPCTQESNKPSMVEFKKRTKLEAKPRVNLWPIVNGVKTCPRCNGSERTVKGECVECRRKYMNEYRKTYIWPNRPIRVPRVPGEKRKGSPRSNLTKEQRAENARRYRAKWARKKYQINPEAGREQSKKWRAANPEKAKQISDKSYWKRPEAKREAALRSYYKNPEKAKARARSNCVNISDNYVAYQLMIPVKVLRNYPDLIEAKRELLKAKRTLKQIDKETNAPESK